MFLETMVDSETCSSLDESQAEPVNEGFRGTSLCVFDLAQMNRDTGSRGDCAFSLMKPNTNDQADASECRQSATLDTGGAYASVS